MQVGAYYFARGSLEYRIIAGISFRGFRLFVAIHDSTVSYASSMMRSGANLYCKNNSMIMEGPEWGNITTMM